jgi:hypothetical protein
MRFKSIVLLAMLLAFFPVALRGQTQPDTKEIIPNVDFCEIVGHPGRYFNQTVIINAKWESGFEFSYLTDDRCGPKFRNEIAVGFDHRQPLSDEIRASVQKIQSHEYGGRAIIRAVGILRNPGRYYGYFRYRFEILNIEDVAHVVVPFQGTLDAGKTYRARVRGDKDFGLALVPSLIIPNAHFATRIEWMNLSNFPALEKLRENSGERQIVFSVMADDIKQMTAQRWNREFKCKIIRLE